jgi:serine O-acetyltransferase
VTLGNKQVPNKQQQGQKRHPTLQDGVTVCAGAMVLGGDTIIGQNSTIGGGAIITHSLPANSLAILGKDGQLKVLTRRSKN